MRRKIRGGPCTRSLLAAAILSIAFCSSGFGAQYDAYLNSEVDPSWDVTRARGKVQEVDFYTDEGTWMSVDVSPDGAWLAFDLLGHIYRMPSGGGDAECLTQQSGVALNYHPRISPDGKFIAFVSDRRGQANLWVMSSDGSDPQPVQLDPIGRITSPVWMPGGKSIVAVREFPTYSMHRRSARLWRFPVNQPAEQPEELVGERSGTQAYWPTVDAKGTAIYFMASSFAAPLNGVQNYQHIRRLDLHTRTVGAVTAPAVQRSYWPETSDELAPELSPDGRWLAFARRIPGAPLEYRGHTFQERTALWLRDLATGEERIVRDPIALDMQNAHGMKNLRVLPGYSWSKDSLSIVLWNAGHLERVSLDGTVQGIPFRARIRRTVSEQAGWNHGLDERRADIRMIRWPTMSRVTGQIVFEAVGELWTTNAKQGRVKPQRLVPWTEQAAFFAPEVSPNGRNLVFVSWNDLELGQVWVCSLPECRPERRSTKRGQYLYPLWDFEGKSIFVLRSRESDPQRIAAGDLVQFDLVRLTQEGEVVVAERVNPLPFARGPGSRLYQVRRRGDVAIQDFLSRGVPIPKAETQLVSIDPSNPDSVRVHNSFLDADRAVPSLDGRLIAYQERFNVLLAPMLRGNAEYSPDDAHYWRGPSFPQPIASEDPRHGVRKLTTAGGDFVRWVDTNALIYASARDITVVNAETGAARTIEIDLVLPSAVPLRSSQLVLKGGRIVTADGGAVIEQGDVVIAGSRIECVGACASPPGARVIDVGGKTLVPGFVDVHAHGGYEGIGPMVPQHYSPSALYLAHGVTTVLDPSTSRNVFALAELVELGRLTGPRTYSSGENTMPTSPRTGEADYAEAQATVRRLAGLGAHSLKIFLSPRRDQRQMLAQAARESGISVTNEGADLYYDVGSILDGHTGFEHPLHYVGLYKDAIEFFARTKAVYSPTLVVAGAGLWAEDYHQARADVWRNPKLQRFMPWQELMRHLNFGIRPKSSYTFPFFAEGVKDLLKAGGYAAVGGHGEMWGLDTHWEIWTYAEALPPAEALRMASMGGARMLGLEKELGSISVGKLADIVVLNSNPLDRIQNTADISLVLKGGVVYDGDTLDEVWPQEKRFGVPAWSEKRMFERPAVTIN